MAGPALAVTEITTEDGRKATRKVHSNGIAVVTYG